MCIELNQAVIFHMCTRCGYKSNYTYMFIMPSHYKFLFEKGRHTCCKCQSDMDVTSVRGKLPRQKTE